MQCVDAFVKWEWPDGFTCPECSSKSYCSLKLRKLDQCNHCHLQMPITANTIFENSKLTLKGQVGVFYNIAWGINKKLCKLLKIKHHLLPPFRQMSRATYFYELQGS